VPDEFVNIRYMVDDVERAVGFYTTPFGFTLRNSAAPAFADVVRGNLRLLLSGPTSSAERPMPDGRTPEPGGWNRLHFIVDDIAAEVERLRSRRREVPQRHHHRARRPADPGRRSCRQPDRALPAGRRIAICAYASRLS
jgi:catechol 2,3-dioxygenase-like lactoylglutathione lyase family enzyme